MPIPRASTLAVLRAASSLMLLLASHSGTLYQRRFARAVPFGSRKPRLPSFYSVAIRAIATLAVPPAAPSSRWPGIPVTCRRPLSHVAPFAGLPARDAAAVDSCCAFAGPDLAELATTDYH